MKLTRRNFLKITAGAAVTTGLAPLARHVILEPFVSPPEELLPGRATWYASTCRQCPAGCGIVVRVINGRAKKIEGNPVFPLNRGKLCARGQAGLQVLYNPDRLRNAVKQIGGRGSHRFEPLYWESAIEELNDYLGRINPARIAFFGGLMPDHLSFIVSTWLEAVGAPPPVMFDLHTALEGRSSASQVSMKLFSNPQLPVYDIANADVIFSFGANFLETWQSPVAYGRAFGEFRQGKSGGRGLLVQFEPRLSMTAASADEWVPLRPGTEGLVALAIGRIILENNLGTVGAFTQEEAALYQDVEIPAMAEASDIPVERLERLARIIAAASRPVAIPGGYPSGQSNGFSAHLAIQSLNLILKRYGQEGGVYLSQPLPVETLPTNVSTHPYSSVEDLIERMSTGDVDLLFVHGTNPVFELPTSSGIADAIARVPMIVSFSPFVDETAVLSDYILPDHTYLEGWGYQVASPSTDRPAVSSQQPVVQPLHDTRSTVDVILNLAAKAGGVVAEALPWADEALYLEDVSGPLFDSSLSAYGSQSPGEFWSFWRQHGGWWSERELRQEPEPIGFEGQALPTTRPSFEGDQQEYPYHLYPYPNIGLSDGRGANTPWLQELPDPMTTARWGTWVELNPETAHKLGVENNQIVKIISPHGEIEAVVVVYPGIRPDMIALPVGQGHNDYGRFAQGRGSNPMALLAPLTDPETGALAWGATRVRVEPTEETHLLARLESLDGEGRETIR
jgi:anaerobic selenocysteine-containing dehydrogenase